MQQALYIDSVECNFKAWWFCFPTCCSCRSEATKSYGLSIALSMVDIPRRRLPKPPIFEKYSRKLNSCFTCTYFVVWISYVTAFSKLFL